MADDNMTGSFPKMNFNPSEANVCAHTHILFFPEKFKFFKQDIIIQKSTLKHHVSNTSSSRECFGQS